MNRRQSWLIFQWISVSRHASMFIVFMLARAPGQESTTAHCLTTTSPHPSRDCLFLMKVTIRHDTTRRDQTMPNANATPQAMSTKSRRGFDQNQISISVHTSLQHLLEGSGL
ncbi:hypothetical protein K437DRAFT_257613 [Tilletiaria anomala UBC 951]|uniref:Secreted protein n=1 Tax=Tilletiaria anomala (strain ATCC 24038 / CBS 436.72 / UBC 951) TaxID=1037660 RepID=A0A066VMW2_TILAU|nr:uncharacterized protein K437DRAFT_257613 [Tilletiaria anomala UBC 951]KDN43092.1 hypothetical protein K437DRAFT_257613 [Tilletiaria anomala UBC 951]